LNQISVVGLTPTVDQHSIKVEGTGSAVISDISVELLENTDIFEEIYPASDEDDSDESDDDDGRDASTKDSDDEALTSAKTEMKAVDEKIVALHDEIKREDEVISSAEKRLVLLEEYGKKFEPKSGADVGEIVDVYDAQRRKTFHDHMEATVRRRKLNAEVLDLQKKRNKLHAQVQKEDKKHVKAALKEAEAKRKKIQLLMARLQKKQNEEKRIHNERCKFWPRSCYTVRITLDATHYTPVSSRRSSVSSVTDLVKPVVDEPTDPASPGTNGPSSACDISLSYVTSAAFWSPSYDLQLNTTANTGTLFFDAQLSNNTSETWKDCKIILSTSQAVFAGLQDNIPSLVPWRIKLAGRVGGVHAGDITNSTEEVEQRRKSQNTSTSTSQDRHGANLIGTTKAIVSRSPARPSPTCSILPNGKIANQLVGTKQVPSGQRSHVPFRDFESIRCSLVWGRPRPSTTARLPAAVANAGAAEQAPTNDGAPAITTTASAAASAAETTTARAAATAKENDATTATATATVKPVHASNASAAAAARTPRHRRIVWIQQRCRFWIQHRRRVVWICQQLCQSTSPSRRQRIRTACLLDRRPTSPILLHG
jgi:hypothetical protein